MTAPNLVLTVMPVPRVRCGSTADTVNRDRAVLGKQAAVVCWFCGTDVPEPYWLAKRPFCCRACAEDWAE